MPNQMYQADDFSAHKCPAPMVVPIMQVIGYNSGYLFRNLINLFVYHAFLSSSLSEGDDTPLWFLSDSDAESSDGSWLWIDRCKLQFTLIILPICFSSKDSSKLRLASVIQTFGDGRR
uniref:Transmembrane protein n=1 Tax=Syphacia muris TaxID=451379 RepID=A0A0N5AVA1_9BILA